MIDTHSHIYLEQFDEDRDEVLARAARAGIKAIFMPAIDFSSLEQMAKLSHPAIAFYKMAGIHPCDVESIPDDVENLLAEWCSRPDIYGVGETGLDYYWSTDHINAQQYSFSLHCRVAKAVAKPVIIHNRESTEDMLDIIEKEQDGHLKGIWHCFNGTVDEGKRALDLGLHLGIGGVITFKNAGVDKTVAQLPLQKMLLETDAPYLAPAPNRGRRNEPAFMKFTAQKLSEIFELPLDEVAAITSENARGLFSIE